MKEFLQRLSIKLSKSFYFLHKLSYKKLGKNSVVYKPMMVRGRKYISLGKNCFIRNGARIEVIKENCTDKFYPELIIGDYTTFEQRLHLTCADKITIGSNCVFSANVYITDLDHIMDNSTDNILNQGLRTKEVSIGNNCFIGMGSFIFAGTKLGNNVIVGANTILKGEYPDDVMVVGGHDGKARIIKKYDKNEKKWIKVQ